MARNFYLAKDTAECTRTYGEFKRAFGAGTGVTILGGWAAYELVDEVAAYESLDIDVLVRRTEAWAPAILFFQDRGYRWRPLGRRTNDQRLEKPGTKEAVDVFYSREVDSAILQRLFGPRWAAHIKDMPVEGFVPTLAGLLEDKFRTLPLRPALDVDEKLKRLKDALDMHGLLFRNRAGTGPEELLKGAVLGSASRCLPALQELAHREARRPEVREVLELVQRMAAV